MDIVMPLALLKQRWDILRVDQPSHEPDRDFTWKLKYISPSLSVHWVGRYHRWGIFRDQRVMLWFKYKNAVFKYCDYFPMLIDVVQGKNKEYRPLDERALPLIDFRKKDILKFLVEMRDAQEKNTLKKEKELDQMFEDHHKEVRHKIEPLICQIRGDVPNISVPITKELKS